METSRRRFGLYLELSVLVFLLLILGAIFLKMRETTESYVQVIFFDVGQGDSVYIKTPSGKQVVIDGGKDSSVLRKVSRELGFFDREIDFLLNTHPDLDHLGGLMDLLDRYKIKYYLHSGVVGESETYRSLELKRERYEEQGTVFLEAAAVQSIDFGDGVYLDILFPDQKLKEMKSNKTSVVARLVYGDSSVILTGDTVTSIEDYLVLKYGTLIDSDVLKVPHHGSRTSSGENFLKVVSPEYSVIQVGKENPYGHPSPEVVSRLREVSDEILQTATHGDIKFKMTQTDFVLVGK